MEAYKALRVYRPHWSWTSSSSLSRLNERAQHVLTLAQAEAHLFNHSSIGTEHLLLGLLGEPKGVAALTLKKLGVSLDLVRTAIEEKIGRGDEPVKGRLDYAPRVREVLSLALSEAEMQRSSTVRTEHILLGIVRDGGGLAADILDTFGALGVVRETVFELCGYPED